MTDGLEKDNMIKNNGMKKIALLVTLIFSHFGFFAQDCKIQNTDSIKPNSNLLQCKIKNARVNSNSTP